MTLGVRCSTPKTRGEAHLSCIRPRRRAVERCRYSARWRASPPWIPAAALMPELAEIETLRSDLEAEFAGFVIERVDVSGRRSVRRHGDTATFARRLVDRQVQGVARRGKFLLLNLDSSDVLVAHMGMSGQLRRVEAGSPKSRHTHVSLSFAGAYDLHFVDPRTFGQMFVSDAGLPELAHLGPDPFEIDEAWLGGLLSRRATKLKVILMDQSTISGIGNMYADEILHAARLRPDRPGGDLSPTEVGHLSVATREVLGEAVARRGSTLADRQYKDLYGAAGSYQELHRVYAREGKLCSRCAGVIARSRSNGRSNFYCPGCQR